MRFVRSIGLMVAIMALATACSSAAADTEVASRTDPAPFDAVLIELFGTDDTDAYLASVERDAAELVVTCMADAGFEFQIPAEVAAIEPPDPANIVAARTRGFGIIDGYRQQISQLDISATQAQDPNVAYLSTLTAVEIDRFFLTLDGLEAEPGQLREGGCNGQASEAAYRDWQRFFDALPNFTALGEERDTHPDWLAAREQWRACMNERGFDYSEPDAIRSDVISRMRDTVGEVYPGGQVPLVIVDGVASVDPEVDVLLDELVEFEIRAAVANVECTDPLADQFDAVEKLVQQEFVDRNQATIDELLQAN